MAHETKFRRILPVLQAIIAISFGGWGLWIRNSVLSRPFLGDSTGWNSTMVYHVWPWPLKFAMTLNLPPLLAGTLLFWPLYHVWPRLPSWVSDLAVLLLIPLFWYWVGSWADERVGSKNNRKSERSRWILLLLFLIVCAAASSISGYVGGYTSYVLFATAIWLAVAIGVKVSSASGKRSKVA